MHEVYSIRILNGFWSWFNWTNITHVSFTQSTCKSPFEYLFICLPAWLLNGCLLFLKSKNIFVSVCFLLAVLLFVWRAKINYILGIDLRKGLLLCWTAQDGSLTKIHSPVLGQKVRKNWLGQLGYRKQINKPIAYTKWLKTSRIALTYCC